MARLSRILSCVAVALAFVLALRSAVAQPVQKTKTVREELPPAAVGAWDDGRLLLMQKTPDYEKALLKFQEAYQLSKNPRVLFNVAVCQKSLNRYAKATATLKQELAEGSEKLSPTEKSEIQATINALERFISTLEVKVDEPDATIFVDDEPVGNSPLSGTVSVDIGERRIKVQKAGFAEQVKRVVVQAGVPARETFTLDPLSKKARVTISVTGVPGATVKMDGIDLGPAPFVGDVSVGRHTFTAEAPGAVSATQTSELKYREPLAITLVLSAKRQEGRLRMEAEPAGAIIEIDGRVVGSSLWEGGLASGSHQVTVKKAGYQTQSMEITMTDDAELRRKLTLVSSGNGNWVAWMIGSAAVVGGGVVAGYFLFRPSDAQAVPGSLRQSVGQPVPAGFRFGGR